MEEEREEGVGLPNSFGRLTVCMHLAPCARLGEGLLETRGATLVAGGLLQSSLLG